jgi:hypothetical protein
MSDSSGEGIEEEDVETALDEEGQTDIEGDFGGLAPDDEFILSSLRDLSGILFLSLVLTS